MKHIYTGVSAWWPIGLAWIVVISACSFPRLAKTETTGRIYKSASGIRFRVKVVAKNLEIPWSLAFTPDGRIFVTERPGRVRVIEKGVLRAEPLAVIKEVEHAGEGGLMGMALDPKFSENRFLYLCYTYLGPTGLTNRVVRYRESSGQLADQTVIVDDVPGNEFHNGCRLRFGPDGKLYVTTGDAGQPGRAQALTSLAGKILRLNRDGTIPSDNPFYQSPIYSYGHRNPQGIDSHPITGLLFSTEHGPVGGDEVNLIEAGKNYGWPVVHHRATKEGMVRPLLEFSPAIAPASGSFYRGDLMPFKYNFFFGALRGKHIHRVVLKGPDYRMVELNERLLDGVFGRIRDVVEGPDGALYFCTSNRDGRGWPQRDDDRVLRIVPAR